MLRKENILLVDDDVNILELLQRHLQSMNYHTYKAVSVKEAVRILRDTPIDLLITDIRMPEVDGMQLLKFASEHYPDMPKLVITGYPSVSGTLKGIKTGAVDYLIKPFTKKELIESIDTAFEHSTGKKNSPKTNQVPRKDLYEGMIGKSEAFQKVTELIERVKNNKATVLINGESGTGKELVARAIHYSGKYARAPFIAVNCGAIPENLQESELFGYLKGAFTGANENRNGFFQAADGGTLFLDEVASASTAVQTKLLRALQEKEILKVGSRKTEKVDIRVIAATNTDLSEEIKKGHFREDLYYRLTVVEINVPPLRERKSDIDILTQSFLQKYGMEYKDRPLIISPEAMEVLHRYNWPGNIRELENVIQRAVILSDGIIGIQHLPDRLKFQLDFEDDAYIPLKQMEQKYIERVLAHTQGNKTKAAEILQIDRKTLRAKLNQDGK
ncbi:sigma-54-dependent transcriptional regulator [Pseudozobellia thermophila]|uniref:DNA-binding transcriptional response regulator, NtrC family, contains REC, AAA-type ATPase, and a Fis-type DNA-binding domains n=1 Tax=Pseudozobellia thermophila TaxID=192903 RepID=A0A1M6IST2_9FLAO|nr:sigma-54 dependent transcriptional regulator [Pseudozobellia thermophila]SHJ37488.1 DNA-binding transcriptional response regulator, NtrC family, contains REC, AAA-type ATPase, and a Fis-type DNA-binding domains [Pseudozobellia thermophila]